ncbi:hypothetical protein V202x_49310 [Gimesia aquarii]|uniref:Uncharacterized protein n=1 Tax=Gimesia aquarii TaxID=2527964 RepID=A0A517X1X4_9PLAN|nr:hypothetical protein V202x_49310 [Gimesia aquarii]
MLTALVCVLSSEALLSMRSRSRIVMKATYGIFAARIILPQLTSQNLGVVTSLIKCAKITITFIPFQNYQSMGDDRAEIPDDFISKFCWPDDYINELPILYIL